MNDLMHVFKNYQSIRIGHSRVIALYSRQKERTIMKKVISVLSALQTGATRRKGEGAFNV